MIILEGTDAVGKSTVIKNLPVYELKDRDKKISCLMDFNLSLTERVNRLKEYLAKTHNLIIILINNNKEELERRVHLRETIDEYDKYTYLYNLLYLETYLYMEYNRLLNNQLFMVDCTGLNEIEQTKKVKKLIDSIKERK